MSKARSNVWKLRPIVNVTDPAYGATGDGVTDDTAAIQAAIDSFATGKGKVYFPPGTYHTTSTLKVLQNRVWLVGDGQYAATIDFVPAGADNCLEIGNGVVTPTQCGIEKIGFTGNNAQVKTAIVAIDTDTLVIRDLAVTSWGGAGSIGLQTKGRQLLLAQNLALGCDKPIVISANPNAAAHALGLDCDHAHFQDLYLTANGNPCVTVEAGVSLTNVCFDGKQAWVKGTHGFYWVDTTMPISSYKLAIRNVRREQSTSAADDNIHIEITGANRLQDLLIENSYFDPTQDGYYLRGCEKIELNHNTYAGGAGRTAMDITGVSETELVILQNTWGALATFTFTSLVKLFGWRGLSNTRQAETAVYSGQASGGIMTGVVAAAAVPAGASYMDGTVLIEDAAVGDRNIIIFAGGQRFRIDGGAAF